MNLKKQKLEALMRDPNERKTDGQNGRRSFFKKAGIGGLSLAALTAAPIEDVLAESAKNVNRSSAPTDLKITDMRIAEVSDVMFRTPIVKLYTNQGIVGYGDVRDGAAKGIRPFP